MSALRDRIKFLADNPEVGVQHFDADEAREFLTENAPTEEFRAGYEAALEDLNNGTIPMWIVGLLDEVEFMGQEPDRHGLTVRGPFFEIDVARAYARTMSTDPDEAVIVPVKI